MARLLRGCARRPTEIEPSRRNVSAAAGELAGDTAGTGVREVRHFGRGHRSTSEVWAAVYPVHPMRSTSDAVRQCSGRSSDWGGCSHRFTLFHSHFVTSVTPTPSPSPNSHPLLSLPLSFSKWIPLPSMDAPPHSPSSSSAGGFFFLAQWAGLVLIFSPLAKWMWESRCSARWWRSCLDLTAAWIHIVGVKEKTRQRNIRPRDLNPAPNKHHEDPPPDI